MGQEGEFYSLVQLCPQCIEDMLNGEFEFIEPTIVCQVEGCQDCDNANVDDYDQLVRNRGKILITD